MAYDRVRGYYIDLAAKAPSPDADDDWFRRRPLHMITCQWGLGCYDRYLAGGGEEWLAAARRTGKYLIKQQEREGPLAGALRHERPLSHTYALPVGWISAMAQGQTASLLTRLYLATGEEHFRERALLALEPLAVPVRRGGVLALLDDAPILQEYPTDPPSHVLNGAIFALWGCWDAARAFSDSGAAQMFESGAAAISDMIGHWDTGYWSLYDLYPHRLTNVAAPWYHALHMMQLAVLEKMRPSASLSAARERFEGYARSRINRTRAVLQKIAFRVVVPKRAHLSSE